VRARRELALRSVALEPGARDLVEPQ
jgi:hypothetical protein